LAGVMRPVRFDAAGRATTTWMSGTPVSWLEKMATTATLEPCCSFSHDRISWDRVATHVVHFDRAIWHCIAVITQPLKSSAASAWANSRAGFGASAKRAFARFQRFIDDSRLSHHGSSGPRPSEISGAHWKKIAPAHHDSPFIFNFLLAEKSVKPAAGSARAKRITRRDDSAAT